MICDVSGCVHMRFTYLTHISSKPKNANRRGVLFWLFLPLFSYSITLIEV
jgi:hypothetical protein